MVPCDCCAGKGRAARAQWFDILSPEGDPRGIASIEKGDPCPICRGHGVILVVSEEDPPPAN